MVNIVTGERATLIKTLAEHDAIDAVWSFADAASSTLVEKASADNMKRTWVNYGIPRNWLDEEQGAGGLPDRSDTGRKTSGFRRANDQQRHRIHGEKSIRERLFDLLRAYRLLSAGRAVW